VTPRRVALVIAAVILLAPAGCAVSVREKWWQVPAPEQEIARYLADRAPESDADVRDCKGVENDPGTYTFWCELATAASAQVDKMKLPKGRFVGCFTAPRAARYWGSRKDEGPQFHGRRGGDVCSSP